ncbi:MAG: hypothetical protein ACPG4Z_04180 [Chitinophagales bacterium]
MENSKDILLKLKRQLNIAIENFDGFDKIEIEKLRNIDIQEDVIKFLYDAKKLFPDTIFYTKKLEL